MTRASSRRGCVACYMYPIYNVKFIAVHRNVLHSPKNHSIAKPHCQHRQSPMVVSGWSGLSGFRKLYVGTKKLFKNFLFCFETPKPLQPLTIGGLPHTPSGFTAKQHFLARAYLLIIQKAQHKQHHLSNNTSRCLTKPPPMGSPRCQHDLRPSIV